jgi:2EXR family
LNALSSRQILLNTHDFSHNLSATTCASTKVFSTIDMASMNEQVDVATVILSEFTLFQELPRELRDEIWDLALPDGRIISIVERQKPRNIFSELRGCTRAGIGEVESDWIADVSLVATPLLHVNRDGREAALRRYQLALDGLIFGQPIYIDFDRDTVLFTKYRALKWNRGHRDWWNSEPHAPSWTAIHAFPHKLRSAGVEGGFFESNDQTFFLQCPLLNNLTVQYPDGNDGAWAAGTWTEIDVIRERCVKAWKERHQTNDAEKLPNLEFFPQGPVKRYLLHTGGIPF